MSNQSHQVHLQAGPEQQNSRARSKSPSSASIPNNNNNSNNHKQYQQHQNGMPEMPPTPSSGNGGQSPGTNQSANVRHIPIYVEGRDEPLVNKNNIDTKSPSNTTTSPSQHLPYDDLPKSGSLFDRVKNFPARNIKNFSAGRRTDSPNRTIHIPINQNSSNGFQPQQHQQQQNHHFPQQQQQQPQPQQPQHEQPQRQQQQQQQPPQQQQQQAQQQQQQQQQRTTQVNNSIAKIQCIQKNVLELMDHVEKFNGCSRKDKQYLYLDEMLTQNLLKLDNIETDGQESIKQARKEAINCINRCIAVLEAKADAATNNENGQSKQMVAIGGGGGGCGGGETEKYNK